MPLLGLWALQNFVGERTGATALLLYLPQHFWALWPLGFLGFGLLKRRRDTLLAGALGLCFWAFLLVGFRYSLASGRKTSGEIRLMSYNIERGKHGIKAIEGVIRAQKPDIVCLQESQGAWKKRAFAPGAQIAARFPGWSNAQSGDVMTLSRFPIVSRRDYSLRGTRRILETTLQTPRGQVRVLNVHVSTSFAGKSYPPRSKIGRIEHIVINSQPSAQARLDQIRPIQNAIAAGNRQIPLIIAGDFNSPPRGLFYRAISGGLVDAWNQGGRGAGSTFPSRFPLLPIDHVLARGVPIGRAFVPNVRASDHRPIVVDLW
ncbi:vancomycin resistance protein VanJ [Abditibacterium utsteinense]|uniref:Vancomycin resistance protein VanJ n=1 Tax=Abditibacterium utsteinense TaxID=1960156 RepID=A0A2S8SVK1_9BACT|nr:endonuclease/exonuclease/phosphatase family protein [Abditibacterium utsteinense]PQV64833.1 vancomycin resistance protein VanJ [Abditibacterium utsteinense]